MMRLLWLGVRGLTTRLRIATYAVVSVHILYAGLASPASAGEASVAGSNATGTGEPNATVTEPSDLPAEIVVTASKRAQRLIDVGSTVSAASAEQLKATGVTDVAELNTLVSGFSAAESYTGFPIFSLRGIGFNASQLSAPPAVSLYVDEAPLPYSVMAGSLLLDVERVEVVKGPQGTLYGQNSTGGSINVIAAKPTGAFSAGLQSEINGFGQITADAHVSGPITDTLRARFAVTTAQFGAWQKGYYLNDRRNGDQDRSAARLLLDWTPTDKLSVNLNLNGNMDRSENPQPQIGSLAVRNPANVYPGITSYPLPRGARDADIQDNLDTRVNNHLGQISLRADYGLSSALKLTSISSYARSKTDIPLNLSPVDLPIARATYGGYISTFNQELRIAGDITPARLHFIAGANYAHDSIDEFQMSDWHANSSLPPDTQLTARYNLTNRATAGFANLDYEVVPDLTLTAGGRYTSTKQTIQGCTSDGGNGIAAGLFGFVSDSLRAASGLPATGAFVPGGCITVNDIGANPDYLPVASDLSQRQSNVSWRAGINYHPTSQSLVYVLATRGFKAGVFPMQSSPLQSEIHPIRQERLTAYEAGAKFDFNRVAEFNFAYFYYDYLDKQFYTYITSPIGSLATIVNIPKSKARGVDADLSITPLDGLTAKATFTYLKTEIGNYKGFNFSQQITDFTGKEFNYAPPYSGTLDIEYDRRVNTKLVGYTGIGGLFNSRTYADLGEVPETKLPGYGIINGRVGLRSADGWFVEFWGRNLADKYYWTNIIGLVEYNGRYAGMPRTFGIRGGLTFGGSH